MARLRVLAVVVVPACAPAGEWVERGVLVPSPAGTDDDFPLSIDLDGDRMVVARQFTNEIGAVVFVRDGDDWVEEQVLGIDGLPGTASIGGAVGLSGDTVALGAPGVDPGGAVFVFVRGDDGWTLQQRLDPTAPDQGRIAFNLAISGDTILSADSGAGAVTVFEREAGVWTQQERWPVEVGSPYGYVTVAISGDTAFVGVPDADTYGATQVFRRGPNGWGPLQLLSEDATGFNGFGYSVAISGNTAIVGSMFRTESLYDTGLGYVFVRRVGRWHVQERLAGDGASIDDGFGFPAAIDDDLALVAAPWEEGDTGAVYAYVRGGGRWTQVQRLTSSEPVAMSQFGRSVDVSGTTAIVATLTSAEVHVFEYED